MTHQCNRKWLQRADNDLNKCFQCYSNSLTLYKSTCSSRRQPHACVARSMLTSHNNSNGHQRRGIGFPNRYNKSVKRTGEPELHSYVYDQDNSAQTLSFTLDNGFDNSRNDNGSYLEHSWTPTEAKRRRNISSNDCHR
jgi:hypothetical protein